MDLRGAVAAVDCGTNSTRLLIVDDHGRTLERQMRITRLGEDVDEKRELAPQAILRTVSVLREYRQLMDQAGVERGRLVATSAVRDSANGDEFLAAAGDSTGLRPELLDGLDEGRLSLAGAVGDLDLAEGPFLVLDIGGGSTELVAGSGPDDPDLSVVSLQLGCVRLTERYLRSDPPTDAELEEAEQAVEQALAESSDDHPALLTAHRLIGLAGTVTTLAALDMGLEKYDRERVHHSLLSAESVSAWYRALAGEVRSARLDRAGMVPGREDVIVAGALVLSSVMNLFGFGTCVVSEADILDGMVATLL